jgi:ABC-2 type transport system ATP-binding protein
MSDTHAIEVRDLHKTYRDGWLLGHSFEALKGISLHVEHGEIFGLLGPNGAGKTTLVKLLLGIVRKTRGSATLLGRPAGDRLGRQRVGYLPENLRIPRHHTAWTALDLYGQMSGLSGAAIRRRRGALLETVELADRARDSVRKYSKGMLQRLGLAIALLHDPDLIFMDEPTDGLDPPGRAQVRQILLQLKAAGKTIFLNSHLLQEVELVCDRVAILDRGILKGIGTTEQLVPQSFEGLELRLELLAGEQAVRSAMPAGVEYRVEPLDGTSCRVQARLNDQQEVDRCVDSLRQHQVSIVALGRCKISLEDAFLEVLARNTDTP